MSTVHVVVPAGIDDPARPSGGNRYDRRVCDGLPTVGWAVRELAVPGGWPAPDAADLSTLARLVAGLPDGAVVLVDGLIGSAAAEVLVPEAGRLRLVILVHLPLGDGAVGEGAVLGCARGIVTTSEWTRRWLLDRYPLRADRVKVARPGAEPGDPAVGTPAGERLLCVGAVVPLKGQDLLVDALADRAALPWHCTLVGPLDRDPPFVQRLRERIAEVGLENRIRFAGALGGDEVGRAYRASDLLVSASRLETYGMVITEALAAGLPVVATDAGGVAEALGCAHGGPPGLLVAPGDSDALGAAVADWLCDADLRRRLRDAARNRRGSLTGWGETIEGVATVLSAADDEPAAPLLRVAR